MNDIFAVFDNDKSCMSFFGGRHKSSSYTIEKSKNTLQFLNMVVQVND